MKYLLSSLLAWIFTKIIYNYTSLGFLLKNININQLFVKTIIFLLTGLLILFIPQTWNKLNLKKEK